MKTPAKLILLGACLALAGCHKETRVDATGALQESFKTAEPAVQQAMSAASTSIKAGNFTDAARVLNPVLDGRQLTPEQKQAAGMLFQQINQALTANPNLETPELYQLRQRLHQGVTSGSRF